MMLCGRDQQRISVINFAPRLSEGEELMLQFVTITLHP